MANTNHASMKLGNLLVAMGKITPQELDGALTEQSKQDLPLGALLLQRHLISEADLFKTLGLQRGILVTMTDLRARVPSSEALTLIPGPIAAHYDVMPLTRNGNRLEMAMADPLNYEVLQDLSFYAGLEIIPLLAERGEIRHAIGIYYRKSFGEGKGSRGLSDRGPYFERDTVREQEDLHEMDRFLTKRGVPSFPVNDRGQLPAGLAAPRPYRSSARAPEDGSHTQPIIRLADEIIQRAFEFGASDVHLEPHPDVLIVRQRVDGILREAMRLSLRVHLALLSRFKILASLDISEKRIPQDGTIRIRLRNQEMDLRLSTLPTRYGEKMAIRLLDSSSRQITLDQLGLNTDACQQVESLLRRRKGILLVTGPTGSGKTTTLYAMVQKVWSPHLNIVTVEDPVEYNMPGVNQVQVRPDIGLGFARCLRALLRQDPDLILVGEIRDSETAEIAFRAAMTGHLVLSTLHTQDAVSAMTRVLDLGVPRYVVSSTLSGVIAQRLVRRRCRQCSRSGTPVDSRSHPIPSALCPICRGEGLFGRIGVYEVLRCSEEIRTLMSMGLNEREIREKAFQEGMNTMMADGLEKVRDGLTTLEEVRRVLEE